MSLKEEWTDSGITSSVRIVEDRVMRFASVLLLLQVMVS